MGSSKKHKKEHKRKHKKSSAADADSPEEKRSKVSDYDEDNTRHRKSHHHKKKSHKRSRDDSRSPDRERDRSSPGRKDKETINTNSKVASRSPDTEPNGKARGGDTSLSVEETNILRSKLGLKPLNVDKNGETESSSKKAEFVHAPAEDLWEKKKRDELREKLKTIKEKRDLHKKMSKVKTLGEDEEEENDISAWVERSRSKEQKTIMKEKREKELMAMDAEFGVGNLVDQEFAEEEKMKKQMKYSSKNLKGMNVEHSLEMFKEGKAVVLTLKDKEILGSDEEDTLISTNIMDDEKAQKNVTIKARGMGYKAYEEEEVDELGFFKPKTMLSKYDEEIDGETKNKFAIGKDGAVDVSWEKQKEEMKNEIRAKGESLMLPELKIASEYYTEQEMTKFKKRKKKVKRVRRNMKPDDLVPLPGESSAVDHGSRRKPERGNIPGWDEGLERAKTDESSITSATSSRFVIVDVDDAGSELQRALDKARKAKHRNKTTMDTGATKVVEHLETLNKISLQNLTDNYSATISLNSTDEFCRQLGQSALEQPTTKEFEPDDDSIEEVEMEIEDDDKPTTNWSSVQASITTEKSISGKTGEEDDSHAPIEAEPLATGGLAGALKLAGHKGYLIDEKFKGSVVTSTNLTNMLQSKNYSIEDKNAIDHLDKYAHEKYSRDNSRHSRGMVTEFEEKKNYTPQVKIEYVDKMGRLMNPKEAFRELSHRFHGKGSGKMKLEKRQKKKEEDDMMLRMSSTDTPLNTVAMMKEKLQNEASPYIVLSGAGKTLQAGGPGAMSKK